MAFSIKFVQAQTFTIAGAGPVIGDTTVLLSSFIGIDGNLLAMSDFGSKGFVTLEPNSGDQEEQISFTGVTQNANGTALLTGVSNVSFLFPYTETSGLAKTHAGGSKAIVTNTSGFYQAIIDYINAIAIAGAPDASTTVQGLVQEATVAQVNAGTDTGSTGAKLFASPADLAASDYGQNLPTAAEKAAFTTDPIVNVYPTSNTWTKPANLKYVVVEVVGAGGGGQGAGAGGSGDNCGTGGGGGGYSKKLIAAASLGATEVVTVGTGGTSSSGGSGTAGGTSSFGAHCQATGGDGGTTNNPGAGGLGSNGNINSKGGGGTTGIANVKGGTGGSSVLGGGAPPTRLAAGNTGGAYGGAGSGGQTTGGGSATAGGAGASGVVIVTEYYI